MKTQGRIIALGAGLLVGISLTTVAHGTASYFKATLSTQPIYVDGQRVSMEAYAINGSNYVKLRDVGKAVGFNVYWDGATVQLDTSTSYTGETPPSEPAVQVPAPITQTSPKVDPSSRDVEALRQEIINRTNAVRVENGLPALPADPMLMKAAQVRAEEMAATTTYSHTRPDGTSCRTVTDCPYISENIHRIICDFIETRGLNVAEFAVRGWTCSDGHLRNILKDRMAGIGVGLAIGVNDFGEESWYCVQQFICKGCTITWVDSPAIP